jgi:HAD superfamily hydrolase (TIGR01509 family)
VSIRALIFDVDGTLAETEDVHRRSFNRAFACAGLDVVWEPPLYADLLQVTGGKRRILHYFHSVGRRMTEELAQALHLEKNRLYAEAVAAGEVALRPGVAELICAARTTGVRTAVATTTSRSNLEALLAATPLPAQSFDVLVCGEDVQALKPDPEVYFTAMTRLGLGRGDCVAFEDSAPGLASALAAGISTIVTPSSYTRHHYFTGAARVIADLTPLSLLAGAVGRG